MCRKKKVHDFWILKMNFEDINFVMTPPSVTKKYEKCDSKVHHKNTLSNQKILSFIPS